MLQPPAAAAKQPPGAHDEPPREAVEAEAESVGRWRPLSELLKHYYREAA